jgi:hypothetical protein
MRCSKSQRGSALCNVLSHCMTARTDVRATRLQPQEEAHAPDQEDGVAGAARP